LSLALAPEKAFPIALATAKKMSWTIVEADPTTRRIEASEHSFWMGFTDDIVVRFAAADSGSRIDCAPRRAMGAAILASTPPASAPTSRR